ncbi:MAG: hypothetical protein ACI9RG_000553 [Sulfurimonas sp.]|jgi:hypothetical protein
MVNLLGKIGNLSFIGMGIFVMLNPKFSARGGTTDLSYMNLNIFVGLALVCFGLALFWSGNKKKTK